MRAQVTPIEDSKMHEPRFQPRQAGSRNLGAIALGLGLRGVITT